jgi:DNA polymerase III epsilon subunit-like protein
MKYIGLDTETGGFEGTSLLTAYFSVQDEAFNELDSLELLMKPEDGKYIVTAEALRINGIDLKQHDLKAMTYKEAGQKLYDFLNGNSMMGQNKLIPVGHNVQFDIQKLIEFLISKGSWQKFVSYRTMDTGVVARACIQAGLIPSSVTGSLGSIAEYFGIPTDDAHTADYDVFMTMTVLEKMLELMRNGKR